MVGESLPEDGGMASQCMVVAQVWGVEKEKKEKLSWWQKCRSHTT